MMCCGTTHQIPVGTDTQVQTIIRDSVVIHRDTITYQIPIESSVAFNVQHSHLETTVAWSDASVDSLGMLNHTLTNKPIKLEKEIVYLDRWKTEYRDSIQVKEVPVEVEVIRKVIPKWCWYLLVFNIILVVLSGVYVYLKLKS